MSSPRQPGGLARAARSLVLRPHLAMGLPFRSSDDQAVSSTKVYGAGQERTTARKYQRWSYFGPGGWVGTITAETQRRRGSQRGDEKGTDERRDAEQGGAAQSGDEGTRDGNLTTERTERTERGREKDVRRTGEGREKDGTDRSPGPSPTRRGMPRQRRSGRRGGHRPLSESPLPFRGGAGGEVNTRLANLYPTSPHPHYGYPHLSFLLPSPRLCVLCALCG